MRKKILIFSISFLVLTLAGCLKDTPSTDLSHEGTIIEMIYPGGASSNGVGTGLEFFSGCTILFPPTDVSDTITYYINVAGTNTLKTPLSYTVAVDDTAIQDNNGNDGLTYQTMPDSLYSILKTKGTIAAGSRLDTLQIVIYPSKIDLTQNYGLPIKLYVPGYNVAANFSIMYLHTIGNPIAGAYNWDWTRWNNTDSSGPTSGGSTGGLAIFAPDNGTQVEVASGYYIGPRYVITFTNNGGVVSNIAISFNSDDIATMKSGGVTVTTPPTIITADPVNGNYEFFYKVSTSAPAPRTVIDHYYK